MSGTVGRCLVLHLCGAWWGGKAVSPQSPVSCPLERVQAAYLHAFTKVPSHIVLPFFGQTEFQGGRVA